MPSEKLTMILKSKSDLSADLISMMSEEAAWDYIYSIREKRIKDNRLQVCFTGFGPCKKSELKKLLKIINLR